MLATSSRVEAQAFQNMLFLEILDGLAVFFVGGN